MSFQKYCGIVWVKAYNICGGFFSNMLSLVFNWVLYPAVGPKVWHVTVYNKPSNFYLNNQ